MLLVGPLVARAQLSRALALRQKATGLAASGGEAAELPVLHDGAAHPVDLGVARDGLVVRVDQDHLEVLVGGVLKYEAAWL